MSTYRLELIENDFTSSSGQTICTAEPVNIGDEISADNKKWKVTDKWFDADGEIILTCEEVVF
jgi:hypothetical protein